MRDTKTIIALSAVAITLDIVACIKISSLSAIGLIPILATISLIINAIHGRPTTKPTDPPESIEAPPLSDDAVTTIRDHNPKPVRRDDADTNGNVLGMGDAHASPEKIDEEMVHRNMFAAGSRAPLGTPTLSTLLKPTTLPGDISLPSRLGIAHVTEIRTTTEQLRTAAQLQGGLADTANAVTEHYDRFTQVPASESVAARRDSNLADLHNLAGWCCFDSGQDQRAQKHYRTAVSLADRVGDDYQMSRGLRLEGVIHTARDRPDKALELYQVAQTRIGPQDDPEIMWLHAVSAYALAKMGHEQASDQLARARDSWSPPNIYQRADMDYQTALVHHELGHLETAEQFAGAVNGAGLHRPVGVLAGILRATIHVQTGEPRGTNLARQAIDEVAGLRSTRARERLAPLAAALAARPGTDARELAIHARRVAGQYRP